MNGDSESNNGYFFLKLMDQCQNRLTQISDAHLKRKLSAGDLRDDQKSIKISQRNHEIMAFGEIWYRIGLSFLAEARKQDDEEQDLIREGGRRYADSSGRE